MLGAAAAAAVADAGAGAAGAARPAAVAIASRSLGGCSCACLHVVDRMLMLLTRRNFAQASDLIFHVLVNGQSLIGRNSFADTSESRQITCTH